MSFMKYAQSTRPARRRLIHGLEDLECHPDAIYWIIRQWEAQGLLMSATDGSGLDGGTFEWVLILPDGTPLVECNGPVVDGALDQI
eukprot:CAMPEP_0119031458 /NCGR_PEP_ID=MMETSP1176-20130426/41553_1 /TAXON_ID=265551 /ORGANISM="Synedropsis recta cf, Strain CCMP1620" /LENGTH=85 /DNA_ID=CAMNT_0006987853 /DNA_START=586 /DNA_END=843 /DNA_ORIENTATION=+